MFQSFTDSILGTSSTVPKSESDDFQDAVEDEVDSEVTFDVAKEEVSLIRADIATAYPEDYTFLSDDYITSVASKPYSKDTSVRRPIEYTTEKLKDLMKWREENAVDLPNLLELITREEGEDSELMTKASALAVSLNYGFLYWHGLDIEGRPVLWIRTDRMVSFS